MKGLELEFLVKTETVLHFVILASPCNVYMLTTDTENQ